MAEPSRWKKLFPNPFYVLLLAASTLFVVTTLGYLIVPAVREAAGPAAGKAAERGMLVFASWLDRNGATALGAEVAAMIAFGLLAMATDRWFAPSK